MRAIVLCFCLVSVTACLGNRPTDPTPIDQQLVLAPGQATAVTPDVSLRFVEVVNDSRCPGDALCIQGGDAIVRIEVSVDRTSAKHDLHTARPDPVEHEDVRIELVQLDPYPFSSMPFDPEDYRATLRVRR